MLEQVRARVGQLERVRAAAHQLDTEIVLEQPQLAAQCGLGDMQPLRRTSEVLLLGDRQEVPQPSQPQHAGIVVMPDGSHMSANGSFRSAAAARTVTDVLTRPEEQ